MFDIVLRNGDTLPKIQKTLYVNGAKQDLSGYTVKFIVWSTAGEEIINENAALEDPQNGVVSYQWTTADSAAMTTDVAFARFEATQGSDKFTVPNNSPLSILMTSNDVSEYSYSGDPSLRPIDEMRFLLGDTDMSKPLFTDMELSYLLGKFTNAYAAAAEGALSFSARYTDLRDKQVGPLSIHYGTVLDKWTNLAKSLRRRGGSNSGAIAITTQRSCEPNFRIGITDYPTSIIPAWQDVKGND